MGPAGGVCARGVVLHHHLSSLKCETSRCNHFYFEEVVSPSEATDAVRSTWLWESLSLACFALLWRRLPSTGYGVTPEGEVVLGLRKRHGVRLLALLFTYSIFHSYFERHNCLQFVHDTWLLTVPTPDQGADVEMSYRERLGRPCGSGCLGALRVPCRSPAAAGVSVSVAGGLECQGRAALWTESIAPSVISPGPPWLSRRGRVRVAPQRAPPLAAPKAEENSTRRSQKSRMCLGSG